MAFVLGAYETSWRLCLVIALQLQRNFPREPSWPLSSPPTIYCSPPRLSKVEIRPNWFTYSSLELTFPDICPPVAFGLVCQASKFSEVIVRLSSTMLVISVKWLFDHSPYRPMMIRNVHKVMLTWVKVLTPQISHKAESSSSDEDIDSASNIPTMCARSGSPEKWQLFGQTCLLVFKLEFESLDDSWNSTAILANRTGWHLTNRIPECMKPLCKGEEEPLELVTRLPYPRCPRKTSNALDLTHPFETWLDLTL